MTLRRRIDHLENMYAKQDTISRLEETLLALGREVEAIEDYLGVKVERYKVIAIEKKETGK